MTRQLALDIEAQNTTEPPDFDDASAWSPFAIALSHRPSAQATPDTAVLTRRDGTERALRQLLCAMANWIHERAPTDTLLTFNGGEFHPAADGFDLPILANCIEGGIDDPELAQHVRSALDVSHRDLFAEIVAEQADGIKWPSLASALKARDIQAATTTLDGDLVDGATMPALGATILNGGGLGAQEHRALVEYASSDVTPLHALATKLDRERVQEAEAAATTEGRQ